ncbi:MULTISPECIES: hypothetical protein [unclassified Haematobacter]|uniref:hypothetical protein n=1 Tax=unclassified Haematobacter TaxID=2640585 RepID=UPI0025BD914F|nr:MULTISPECIES: hypothetical protein [unclassified Haematobacter]
MLMTRHYAQGTVTVSAGGTAVTGSGTGWAGAIRAGDVLWIAGITCRIASIESATSLTLARPWPGPAASATPYEIWLTPDDVLYGEATRQLIDMLDAGALSALSDVTMAPDRVPYFNGAATAATTNLTPAARAILALAGAAGAKIPVVTGAGTAALRDVVGTVAQASGVPTGAIIETGSSGNGSWWRFAGGLQVCIVGERSVAHNGADNNQLRGSWPFPAQFSAVPAVFWSLNPARQTAGNVDRMRLGNIWMEAFLGSVNLYGARQASAPAWASGDVLSGLDLIAVGRWHA